MSAVALYRQSKIGECLVESLDQLIKEEKITPDLAIRILEEVCTCVCVCVHGCAVDGGVE